jgi:CubicO group peptidase (beta-lactamase class C family)
MKSRWFKLALLLACCFVLLRPAPAVPGAPGLATEFGPAELPWPTRALDGVEEPPAADLKELRERLTTQFKKHNPAGLSFALVEGGEVVWTEGFGWADREAELPATPDTLYRVGSHSKSLVSLAMLALVEDGKVALEDTVRDHLPELDFHNDWEREHPITIAQLLEHSSGFDEMRFNEWYVPDGEPDLPLSRVLELNPRSRVTRWRPGTRHGYSQPGYTVAARIIEKSSGQPFEDFIAERVFQPLSMDDASFRYDEKVRRRVAKGYAFWHAGPLPHRRIHHRAGGGLYVSANDLGKLVEFLLARGKAGDEQVLEPRSIARMERGETLPYEGLLPDYGLGNYRHDIDGIWTQGHGGWMPGFAAIYRYFPDLDAGFVMMSNYNGETGGHFWQLEWEVVRYLLKDAERPEPPEYDASPEQLAAYEGTYRTANPHVAFLAPFERLEPVFVRAQDGELLARGFGEKSRLIPTGPGTFRMPWERSSSTMFTTLDGREVASVQLALFEKCTPVEAFLLGPGMKFAKVMLGLAIYSIYLWLPRLVLVGYRRMRGVGLWVLPWMSAYCFAGMCQLLFNTPPEWLADPNQRTIGIFLYSWGFCVFAWVGLLHTLRSFRWRGYRTPSLLLRAYALGATVALSGLAIHFARHGYLGVRTWMW